MVTRYVNTASTPGGDGTTNATVGANRAYASLAEWEAARQADLTAADSEQVICDGTAADTAALAIDGWTTDATHYIRVAVAAAARHVGVWSTSKFRLYAAVSYSYMLDILEEFVRIEGLQVGNSSPDGGLAVRVNAGWGSGDIRFLGVIENGSDNHGFNCINGSYTVTANNVIASNNVGSGFVINCDHRAYNCVAVNNGGYGFWNPGWTAYWKNNYAGGNTGADYQNDGTANYTTCFSEDGTGTTTTAAFSTSAGAYFTSITAGSEDLAIGASSALKDAGTDLSADSRWFDKSGSDCYDITGAVRGATWDVGVYEVVAAAGKKIPVFMRQYRQRWN